MLSLLNTMKKTKNIIKPGIKCPTKGQREALKMNYSDENLNLIKRKMLGAVILLIQK